MLLFTVATYKSTRQYSNTMLPAFTPYCITCQEHNVANTQWTIFTIIFKACNFMPVHGGGGGGGGGGLELSTSP